MVEPVFTVDERQIRAHIDALPQELRDAAVAHLGPVDGRMLALVLAAAPQGRTGRLRSQIRGAVVSAPTSVVATVFVAGQTPQDFAKAGALEFGVPGLSSRAARRAPGGWVSVRAYTRQPGESVRAYRHRMRMAARRYLRRAIVSMQTAGQAAIQDAIDETVTA